MWPSHIEGLIRIAICALPMSVRPSVRPLRLELKYKNEGSQKAQRFVMHKVCKQVSQCNYVILGGAVSYTDQPLLSDTICRRHLSFFGHLCRADTSQDHSRALQACIRSLPKTGDAEPVDRGKPG